MLYVFSSDAMIEIPLCTSCQVIVKLVSLWKICRKNENVFGELFLFDRSFLSFMNKINEA